LLLNATRKAARQLGQRTWTNPFSIAFGRHSIRRLERVAAFAWLATGAAVICCRGEKRTKPLRSPKEMPVSFRTSISRWRSPSVRKTAPNSRSNVNTPFTTSTSSTQTGAPSTTPPTA